MDQPAQIGRYTVVSRIGSGGMGVVYKAIDPALGRVVAIKTINLALGAHDLAAAEERFFLEARAAGSLNHPNIVTVYDVGRSGELAYIAMELLDGLELRALLAADRLAVSVALDIAAQVADGLAYAHERGVVHRDIKPANIVVLPGDCVKITDFGIASIRTDEARTHSGVVLGSPRYLAPEQILRKQSDARSDIFSLGVTLYEMVTGRAPFAAADVNAILYQILNVRPEPPSVRNAALPQMLDLIVAKALAKDPAERYQRIDELAADLRACVARTDRIAVGPAEASDSDHVAPITAEVSIDTGPVSSGEDIGASRPGEAAAYRVAREFDCSQAMSRFLQASVGPTPVDTWNESSPGDDESSAAADGAEGTPAKPRAAARTSDLRTPDVKPWSRRDYRRFVWAMFGSAAVAAVITLM